MECPSEGQLVRLIGGEAEAQPLAAHVEACPMCAKRVNELREVWRALADANVVPPPRSLAAGVLDAASRAQRSERSPGWGRLAAAIVLGCGVGLSAALLGGSRGGPQPAPASSEQLVGQLGLDELCSDDRTMATLFASELDAADEQEVSS